MIRFSPLLCVVLLTVGQLAPAADRAAAWQLTLRPGRPGAVFDVTETPRVTALVRNVAGRDQAASV